MSLPRIRESAQESRKPHAALPAELECLIGVGDAGLPASGARHAAATRGGILAFAIAVAVCSAGLIASGLLLGRLLAPEGGRWRVAPAAPSPVPFVVLGRSGGDVINCVQDTVIVFVPGRSAHSGRVSALFEAPTGSLAVQMASIWVGYWASIDVQEGRLRGSQGGRPTLAVAPGQRITVRVTGTEGKRTVKVVGRSWARRWMEMDTC